MCYEESRSTNWNGFHYFIIKDIFWRTLDVPGFVSSKNHRLFALSNYPPPPKNKPIHLQILHLVSILKTHKTNHHGRHTIL